MKKSNDTAGYLPEIIKGKLRQENTESTVYMDFFDKNRNSIVTVYIVISILLIGLLIYRYVSSYREKQSLEGDLAEWQDNYVEEYQQRFEEGWREGYEEGNHERWLENEIYKKGYDLGIEDGMEMCVEEGCCFEYDGWEEMCDDMYEEEYYDDRDEAWPPWY